MNKVKTFLFNMDELVHDLSVALEESSQLKKAKSADNIKDITVPRQKTKKHYFQSSQLLSYDQKDESESSESSLGDAFKYQLTFVKGHQQSDSDDVMTNSPLLLKCTLPASLDLTSMIIESDSVTDNVSQIKQMKPHRRRKFKQMVTDSTLRKSATQLRTERRHKKLTKQSKNTNEMMEVGTANDVEICENMQDGKILDHTKSIRLGKRKRTYKYSGSNLENEQGDVCSDMPSPLSSSSLSDSDPGFVTYDEGGREGDDEQSDFFHESGPSSGVPSVFPWWSNYQEVQKLNPNLKHMIADCFQEIGNTASYPIPHKTQRNMTFYPNYCVAKMSNGQAGRDSVHRKNGNNSANRANSLSSGDLCKRRKQHSQPTSENSS